MLADLFNPYCCYFIAFSTGPKSKHAGRIHGEAEPDVTMCFGLMTKSIQAAPGHNPTVPTATNFREADLSTLSTLSRSLFSSSAWLKNISAMSRNLTAVAVPLHTVSSVLKRNARCCFCFTFQCVSVCFNEVRWEKQHRLLGNRHWNQWAMLNWLFSATIS